MITTIDSNAIIIPALLDFFCSVGSVMVLVVCRFLLLFLLLTSGFWLLDYGFRSKTRQSYGERDSISTTRRNAACQALDRKKECRSDKDQCSRRPGCRI